MQIHPLSETALARLLELSDKMPTVALLRVGERTLSRDERPSEDELKSLAEATEIVWQLELMGARIGEAFLYRAKREEAEATRWEIRIETLMLDRYASFFRGVDWKHGLIGGAIRGVSRAAGAMGLDSGPVAPLMNPEEFAALRWDSSRNKEKDRGKEIPLVNVSAQGGGATPSTRLMSKAKKR